MAALADAALLRTADARGGAARPTAEPRFRYRLAPAAWSESAWRRECTLHQLSPFIGKMKSSVARALVSGHSGAGETIYDPFSGSGTVALEGWIAGRKIVANDLSPYAQVLTRAKLRPPQTLEEALSELHRASRQAGDLARSVDLRRVSPTVRPFFHPRTLREIVAWVSVLRANRQWFLLACLLGILHHQRPGFLSFPCSHMVPYLRSRQLPRESYPALYEYRQVEGRLRAKVERAFRRVPNLDRAVPRRCYAADAAAFVPKTHVDAIITSPPYMRQLDYGRDNRLRLWFLGCRDTRNLDMAVSPREGPFLALMERCFRNWRPLLAPKGHCVLVVGQECSRSSRTDLPSEIARIATRNGAFRLVSEQREPAPIERRRRPELGGSRAEAILVLQSTRAATF